MNVEIWSCGYGRNGFLKNAQVEVSKFKDGTKWLGANHKLVEMFLTGQKFWNKHKKLKRKILTNSATNFLKMSALGRWLIISRAWSWPWHFWMCHWSKILDQCEILIGISFYNHSENEVKVGKAFCWLGSQYKKSPVGVRTLFLLEAESLVCHAIKMSTTYQK